jgi:hypothetical protein
VASRPRVSFFSTRWQHQSRKLWMGLCNCGGGGGDDGKKSSGNNSN